MFSFLLLTDIATSELLSLDGDHQESLRVESNELAAQTQIEDNLRGLPECLILKL